MEPDPQEEMADEPQTQDLKGSHESYTEHEEENEPNSP